MRGKVGASNSQAGNVSYPRVSTAFSENAFRNKQSKDVFKKDKRMMPLKNELRLRKTAQKALQNKLLRNGNWYWSKKGSCAAYWRHARKAAELRAQWKDGGVSKDGGRSNQTTRWSNPSTYAARKKGNVTPRIRLTYTRRLIFDRFTRSLKASKIRSFQYLVFFPEEKLLYSLEKLLKIINKIPRNRISFTIWTITTIEQQKKL